MILNLFSAIGFLRYAKQRVIYTDIQYYFVYVNLRRLRLHLHNLILEFEFVTTYEIYNYICYKTDR